jgi:hypothetical protein
MVPGLRRCAIVEKDRSGVEAIRFVFDAAKSMATGKALSDDTGKHGKLRFPEHTTRHHS